MTFRRTAATDYVLGEQAIAAGEKVVMFYASGNFDTDVFDTPARLDLGRKPNPHLGFGGGGRHFCLGAHVARAQLRAIFAELLTALPDIEADDPVFNAGNFIHNIAPCPSPSSGLCTRTRGECGVACTNRDGGGGRVAA